MNPYLRDELLAMLAADTRVRDELEELGELEGGYHPRMEAVHAENARRLKEIIADAGWPGHDLVGDDGAEAAWRIVQHAIGDPQFQRSALTLVRDAAARGDAPGWQAPYLEDRICLYEGRPQIYGTQHAPDANGYTRRWETVDPDQLDERRRAVGLDPIDPHEDDHIPRMPPARLRDYFDGYYAWLKRVGWR